MLSSRSLVRSCLAFFAFLVVLPAITLADGVPADPEIVIDTGGGSPGITAGINTIQPDGNAFTQYAFVNDGALITSFTLQFFINSGFPRTTIDNNFSCSSGYFLGCTVSYNSDSGSLTYLFSGVNPSDGDENVLNTPFCQANPNSPSCDTEFGEREGIPSGGHFFVTLNNYVDNAPAVGGGTLYSGRPTFNNSFTTVPEPSEIQGLLAGVFLIGVFARKFRRRDLRSPN